LRVAGHGDLFAAGDTIAFPTRELPKSGVYAVRAGPVLADNIRRRLTGRRLRPFRPQREALYLVSTGERHALGARNGLTVEGTWVWRWKDWIDRRFMRKFNELPDMAPPRAALSPLADRQALKEISAIAMRCGGCGAKVGASVLARALGNIEPAARGDVVVGLDAPDDAALVDVGGDRLSLQTVDYFRAIVDDPYLLGKIAVNHALGDVYAMGGEPQTALAIATVPYGLESKVEADLSAMMAGANEVLREAGCALVGGHTSEGAELALGFAVNGHVQREAALRKNGLRPGDALVLTKPIGTGTLLAADMRGKAKARWVMAAIAHMIQSNRRAAEILRRHGVHAATDVTGFGLLGHLVEMVRASEVDVTVAIERVPLLDGARETVGLGIFSSLQPQNVRLRRAIAELETVAKHPLYPLLFDPQTSGGLLAAVPLDEAEHCVAALRAAGYTAADVIGFVAKRSGALEPVTLDLTGARLAEALAGQGEIENSAIAVPATTWG
jgi:selenide, water dikinase